MWRVGPHPGTDARLLLQLLAALACWKDRQALEDFAEGHGAQVKLLVVRRVEPGLDVRIGFPRRRFTVIAFGSRNSGSACMRARPRPRDRLVRLLVRRGVSRHVVFVAPVGEKDHCRVHPKRPSQLSCSVDSDNRRIVPHGADHGLIHPTCLGLLLRLLS